MPRIIPAPVALVGQMLRLALVILLVSAAPASAQWSPPTAISGAGENWRPHLAFSPAGERLDAWTRFRGDRASILASGVGRLTRDGDQLTGPVGFGARSFALAWTDGRRKRLYLRVRKQRRTVARGRRISSPVLAGNADGRLALAWFDDRGTRDDAVMVAMRRPGGGWMKPARLASERVRSVSVAVGESGQVLVAWDAYGKVRARLRRASRFGRTDTIRSFQAFNARLQTAVAANGRAIVGWTAKFRSEGGAAGPTYQQVAVRPSGGSGRFRAAQLLSQTPDAPDAEGTLRLDVSGEPQVAWTQEDGIFRSRPDGEGVFGAAEPIASAGAVLQDVAGGHVFWTQGRALTADGVRVSAPGATQADAAIDPLTGRPSVVWLQDGRVMTSSRG